MLLRESNRVERIAVLTERLVISRVVCTADFAREMKVTPRTIQRDLAAISRVLTIYPDSGRWIYEETVEISPY
jgi:predicted DNA-binding transcriptional regulator YafY